MITKDSIRYAQYNDKEIGLYILESDLPNPPSNSTKHLELIKKILEAYKDEN